MQTNYNKVISNQSEDVQAILNTGYSNFIINNVEFEDFPPLKTSFGSININVPTDQILFQKIGNVTTETPLLFTFESNNRREAVLLGEDIWKWRSQHFLDTKSFKGFDEFFGKLIQYLASNQHKRRLNVDYESFYNGNTSVLIKAQYFNKNYEFDARESLQITVTDKSTNAKNTFPLLLKGNFYEVDLSSLKPSEYDFTVKATSENISTSGSFTILDHNIEQQFLNANVSKLQQLATNSQGASSFTDDYNTIVDSLLLDKRYVPIQKSTKKTVSFVDWKYLLALIVLSLALEWFIRKYNGLI